MQNIGSGGDEQIRQAWRYASRDHRRPAFVDKIRHKMHLLGAERMTGIVGGRIEVVASKAKRGSDDGSIEHWGAGVHEQLSASRGFHDAPDVASIDLGDADGSLGAQKITRALDVAIAARYLMSLSKKKVGKQGTGRTDAQNKDPHGARAYHSWSAHAS